MCTYSRFDDQNKSLGVYIFSNINVIETSNDILLLMVKLALKWQVSS